MFNRNKESQNISQFISKGQQIIEENSDNDDEDTSHFSIGKAGPITGESTLASEKSQKAKHDEEFMFQMDRGITLISNHLSNISNKSLFQNLKDHNFANLKKKGILQMFNILNCLQYQDTGIRGTKINES